MRILDIPYENRPVQNSKCSRTKLGALAGYIPSSWCRAVRSQKSPTFPDFFTVFVPLRIFALADESMETDHETRAWIALKERPMLEASSSILTFFAYHTLYCC